MTDLNPCHPAEQQARQDRLEQAYLESGRTNGVYTGLLTTPEPAPVPEAPAATKLLRVVRREFYDAYGATTYYLRVPVGMTAEEIEQHDCWHDGIDKDSHPYRDGLVCVGRVNGSDADVIATLETTGGREIDEVTEITEADLLLETEESASEEEVVSDETITIPRAAFDDMCEWIEAGLDLGWWHENDDHREDQPETWELAQRVAEHLRLGYTVAPASEGAAADG